MKAPLLLYLFLVYLIAIVIGCTKSEDANCQSETYWVDIDLNGTAYNTLTPCIDWYITVDSLTQSVENDTVLGSYYFTKLVNKFTIWNSDSSVGKLEFDMFFFAPDSLVQTTIAGTDTTRFMSPESICTLLDSNYHRLGNSLQDTVAVVTNILYTDNAGNTTESIYIVNNWQTPGFGYQPIEIEGVVDGECRTRFEMNALLSDSTLTDTIPLFGRVRLPFK